MREPDEGNVWADRAQQSREYALAKTPEEALEAAKKEIADLRSVNERLRVQNAAARSLIEACQALLPIVNRVVERIAIQYPNDTFHEMERRAVRMAKDALERAGVHP